jgi:hypothetical protein
VLVIRLDGNGRDHAGQAPGSLEPIILPALTLEQSPRTTRLSSVVGEVVFR